MVACKIFIRIAKLYFPPQQSRPGTGALLTFNWFLTPTYSNQVFYVQRPEISLE
jgi:hypothetical protein